MKHIGKKSRNSTIPLFMIMTIFGIILSTCMRVTPMTQPETVTKDTATPDSPATVTPIPPTTELVTAIDLDGTL